MPDQSQQKTIAFSFDGTGNEPSDAGQFTEDESISNVLKLHVLMGGAFEIDHTDTKTLSGKSQRTFYYNGIGTREEGRSIPLLGRLRSMLNMALAPRWGDAARILREARQDFVNAYEKGDRVAVFGFSRGAALARKFASLILSAGECEEVAFLGVFDTVAAMNGIHRKGEKISTDVVFENGTLHENVLRAVHIVSLDENRVPFSPTLINKDKERPDRILEVWFPGVHSDIGGGYWLDGLSDLALEFMIAECKRALREDIRIVESDRKTLEELLAAQGEALPGMEADDFAIHPMAHGVLHTHSGLMASVGEQEPRVARVNDNDVKSKNPEDLPLIHHSVRQRFREVADYRPPALRGLTFRLLMPDGDILRDAIQGISGLRAQ